MNTTTAVPPQPVGTEILHCATAEFGTLGPRAAAVRAFLMNIPGDAVLRWTANGASAVLEATWTR